MKPNRRIGVLGVLFAVLTIAILVAAGTPVWSQETTANITGIVSDASGAPIAGATITAADKDRGTVWTSQTDSAGLYNITQVPVGNYTLKVEAKGFQTAVFPAFTLVLDQTARMDVMMKVGSVSQSVEVTSEAPILQTQSAEVSTLIDSSAAEAIPLAGRNYIELTLLAPGVTHVDPDSLRQPQNMLNSGRPYINGNREQADEFLLDGQLNDESKNNEVAYTPSIDAIQEFNVITQNASAEFGNYQGGIISASIKSGTNQFHGAVFEFFRNDALDANNASAGWTKGVASFENPVATPGFSAGGVEAKPELRYNMFGATIGGPIIKNKLFFFADYQGQRLLNAGLTGTQLLTTSARAGDFGQLCTDFGGSFNSSGVCTGGAGTTQLVFPAGSSSSGGPIPFNNLANAGLTQSAFATNLFASKYYPAPQIDSLNGNNDFFNSGNELNNDQGDIRLDYKVSEKDGLFGRWSQANLRNPLFTDLPFALDGAGESVTEPLRNGVVSWTHTFSPSMLNEARFGFSAIRFSQDQTPTSGLGNISEQLGITGANFQAPGLIEIDAGGSGVGASASLGLRNLVQIFHTTEGQLEDNLIITRGRHTIKTGFQFVRERQDYIYPGNNGALGYLTINDLTGSTLSDLWLGNVSGGFRDTGGSSTLDQLRGNIYSVFVQDDWRITPTLTLNLGVRFEDHTPLYELHDREVNFNLYTGAIETPQNGYTNALYDNYLGVGDYQPRIGFAWSPTFWGGHNVIRAGYAISSYMEGGGSNEELTQNQPYGIVQQSFPVGDVTGGFGPPNFCTAIDFACYAGQRIRLFDQHFRPSQVQQWNLTIQHQFNNTTTLQAGYVGEHGVHLLNFEDVAQREGLNAAGGIAQPGQLIVNQQAGPFLGGGSVTCAQTAGAVCGAPGSLYAADQTPNNSAGEFVCCGALAGANMSNSDQSYNALQMVLQKRLSSGLEAQVAYTYSKCLSNSPGYFGTGWASTNATSSGGQPGMPNIYDPRSDWGPCYYDQKQILSAYTIYQLPVGRGRQFGQDMNPILNAIVGDWGISGFLTVHSGNAFTLNEFGGWGIGGDTSHTNGIEPYTLSGLPDCNGPIKNVDQLVPATSTTPAFIQWFDTSNVSNPAPYTFGTCRPGNVRGPAYASVDLNLFKDFPITEHKSLEFRFEALNAFNHPVWTFSGGPAAGSFNTGSGSFGDVTGSQGARQVQFALKFYY